MKMESKSLNKLTICDGKYTICWTDDFKVYKCLRHGEEWRDLRKEAIGDNMLFGLITELYELKCVKEILPQLRSKFQQIICYECKKQTDNDGSASSRGWKYSFFHPELTRCPDCQ